MDDRVEHEEHVLEEILHDVETAQYDVTHDPNQPKNRWIVITVFVALAILVALAITTIIVEFSL